MVILFQECGNLQRIGAMALHTQGERLQAKVQQESILQARLRSQITHQVSARFGDISRIAELLAVDNAMIGFIRLCELREFPIVPVKFSTVHNHAANLYGMSVHILGGGVDDNIRPEFKWPAIDWGCKGVVHNQRNPMRMRHFCKEFQICHNQGRIRERLRKNTSRIRLECSM